MIRPRICLTLLPLVLGGCGGMPGNRSLDSLHQPVVERGPHGAHAEVPGCPDWSARSGANLGNATHPNFGCAVNGNLAAMIADPDDLIHGGTDTGDTEVMTASKAIASYRDAKPTAEQGLAATSTRAAGGEQP